jgi:hypothetical protein
MHQAECLQNNKHLYMKTELVVYSLPLWYYTGIKSIMDISKYYGFKV